MNSSRIYLISNVTKHAIVKCIFYHGYIYGINTLCNKFLDSVHILSDVWSIDTYNCIILYWAYALYPRWRGQV